MKAAVIKYDFVQIGKDPMLLASNIAPLLFWIILKFGFPAAGRLSESLWQFDISPWFDQAAIFFLTLIPMMYGMAYGFMLLDERDEGIITAISVTPLGKSGYMRLRMGLPVIISTIFIMLFCKTLGIAAWHSFLQLLLPAFVLSLCAPFLLLVMGAFAKNKVMGVAISKGFGIFLAAPLIDYILPGQLKWLGAYSPCFWLSRAFLSTATAAYMVYIAVAILFQAVLIYWLYRRFTSLRY